MAATVVVPGKRSGTTLRYVRNSPEERSSEKALGKEVAIVTRAH